MTASEGDPANKLKAYIATLPEWVLAEEEPPYDHMGAVITDAGLQAGINYRRVVYPRVERLLSDYPGARTTSSFLQLLNAHGAAELLSWNGTKKLDTITHLAAFFAQDGVETTEQLRAWLQEPEHLVALAAIKGVGSKTVDYIQILVGIPQVAVDVHLRNFVKQADMSIDSYGDVRELIARTADLMGVDRSVLDHSIWTYMSRAKLTVGSGGEPTDLWPPSP